MAKGHGNYSKKGGGKPSGRSSKGARGHTGKQTRASGPGPGTSHEKGMKGSGGTGKSGGY